MSSASAAAHTTTVMEPAKATEARTAHETTTAHEPSTTGNLMGTTTLDHYDAGTNRAGRADPGIAGVPFGRLLRVELRKMVDTRAGRWLLIVIAALLGGVVAIVFFSGAGGRTFGGFLSALSLPLVLVTPIVAILAATAEFSQRTALTTFALEPRRPRVVAAKTLASLLVGVAAYASSVAFAAAGHAASIALRDTPAAWSVQASVFVGLGAVLAISVLQGLAFGLALLNTPLAITAFLVLPTAWAIVASLVPRLVDVAPWVDLGAATAPLFDTARMAAADWAHLASASTLWVLLPLAIGLWRVQRREA